MSYNLYGSPFSPYMRAVQIVFAEHGIAYKLIPIGPADLSASDYGTLHPYRKLPTLDHNGERVFETSAIMTYVDEQAEHPLQPSDPLQKARSNQWLSAANSYIYRDAFTNLYFLRVLAPQFGIAGNSDVIAEAIKQTAIHLTNVEEALNRGELGGPIPSLADILVGSILILLRDIDEGSELLEHTSKTREWLGELASRPSFQSTRL